MGFKNTGGGFTAASRRFEAGFGMVIDLLVDLPRKYEEAVMGRGDEKGFVLTGTVVDVLGGPAGAPALKSVVSVLLRPGDARKAIFDDLEKTREGMRFLLEGVTGSAGALVARWVHGAGVNRQVEFFEIVGPTHVSFENPVNDGPKHGRLSLNLDGSPTVFDVWCRDHFEKLELPYQVVVDRLKMAMDQNLNFRVTQRVLVPSKSVLVDGDVALAAALVAFRQAGFTGCVVRSFVPGTQDAFDVDVQVMSWPFDVAANAQHAAQVFEMPVLQETKKFVALRDGDAQALMEVIPGRVENLIGNADVEKSTKHKFARSIVKGLSDGQKNMYGMQGYGPAILINAVNEVGVVTGMTRLAVRVDGDQFRNLMTIPSPHFSQAASVRYVARVEDAAVAA